MSSRKPRPLQYFQHDSSARNDLKLRALRAKYGNDGYALFFCLLELQTELFGEAVDLSDPVNVELVAAENYVTAERLIAIIDYAAALNMINRPLWEDERKFSSFRLTDWVLGTFKRRETERAKKENQANREKSFPRESYKIDDISPGKNEFSPGKSSFSPGNDRKGKGKEKEKYLGVTPPKGAPPTSAGAEDQKNPPIPENDCLPLALPGLEPEIKSPKAKKPKKELYTPAFERFYAEYPRKVGREEAAKSFAKRGLADNIDEVLSGLRRWKPHFQATAPEYVPYPATFLNNARWKDDPGPVSTRAGPVTSPLHVVPSSERQGGPIEWPSTR